ncbi:MAG: effector binding domain-containing protein [Candidatus Heimdallarchaeaceae archaeon]
MNDSPFSSNQYLKLFILESAEDIADFHKILDHPTRIEILARLLTEDKEFSELQEEINISKTSLANHLTQLVDFGLVERKDRGIYQISFDGEDVLKSTAKVFLDMKIREQQRLESLRLRYESMIKRYTNLGGEKEMDKFRIIRLPAMRVVSFHAMGEFLGDPETKAGRKMHQWAYPKGLYDRPDKHHVFGFNNPDPEYDKDTGEFIIDKEHPYGYEFWITVPDDFKVEEGLTVKEIHEGLFVDNRCKGINALEKAWKELGDWVKTNEKYSFGKHQCLEQPVNPLEQDEDKIVFDLYFPIM